MEENNNTIQMQSPLGQRMGKITKKDDMQLSFQGQFYPIVSTMSIGRDKKNDITLDDTLVSRKHALIQKIKNAYFIKDLNSTNGTFVNGNKVPPDKYIKLSSQDVVKIGRMELIIK